MTLILFCRNKDCGKPYEVTGQIPSWCPVCSEDHGWTTTPPGPPTIKLTANDKKFLKGVKISPEP